MNVVIGSEEWPPEMATTRSNILQPTKLDEEIRTNTGEDRSVLPHLEELYLTYGGRSASKKLDLFRSGSLHAGRSTPLPNPRCAENLIPARFESTNMNANEISPIEGGQVTELTNTNANGESELGSGTTHEKNLKTNGHNIYALRKLNITTFNISWESYRDTIIHSQERLQVDMILTDPPYQLPSSRVPTGHGYDDSIDDIHMDQFSQFARRVLKPGGYCLLFTSWQKLLKWSEALEKHSFILSKKGMTFVKKSSMLRSLTSLYFPQNALEYGIVAQKQGGGPTRFQPPYDEPYGLVKSQHSRRFNVIENIMPVRRKLKVPGSNNKPMRIEEKSALLLSELLHTFCPENGLVLDCYGGTLTTALACIATDRKAIVIEKDENCYREALKRLENVAEAKLRMLWQISGLPGDQALHEMDLLRVVNNNDDENESESNEISIDNDEAQDAIEEENFPSTAESPLDNASQNSQGDVITSDRGADSYSEKPSSTMSPSFSGEGKDVPSKHHISPSTARHEDT